MAVKKKTPLRMCLACRQMLPKRELTRVVRDQSGNVSVDTGGKAAGRGAYLCFKPECLEKLFKQRLLNRNYSCEIPAEVYQDLRSQIEASRSAQSAEGADGED